MQVLEGSIAFAVPWMAAHGSELVVFQQQAKSPLMPGLQGSSQLVFVVRFKTKMICMDGGEPISMALS